MLKFKSCFFINLILITFFYVGCSSNSDQLPEHEIVTHGVSHPGRKWVQKEFFLSTFSAVPSDSAEYMKALSLLKKSGFNYVETAHQMQPVTEAILQESEKQQLNVMAQDKFILGARIGNHIPFHSDSVKRFLDLYGDYASLKAVYISDEPLAEENEIVRSNIDEFERLRPDLLGFSVLLPSYYKPYGWTDYTEMKYDEYVDRYISEVDPAVLSTDYYPFFSLSDTTIENFYKSLFWKDMGLYRNRALKYDMIHWFYYQTRKYQDEQPQIKPEYITVQAWAAILYGVKGLSTFTALGSVVNKDGEKDYLFDTQKELNKEINALGNTLLSLKSTAVYHAENTKVPDEYADEIRNSNWLKDLPNHLSAGEFVDKEGNCYILFLNKDFTSKHDFSIPLKQTSRIYTCDKKSGGKQSVLLEGAEQFPISLDAGDAALIRIENEALKPKLIIYNIL